MAAASCVSQRPDCLGARPGLLSFFKCLKDIYTPVENEVEVKQTEKTLGSELTNRLADTVKASQ